MLEDLLYSCKNYYDKNDGIVKSILGNMFKVIPYGLRYGPTYLYYSKLLNSSAYWTEEELRRYQWDKVREVLKYAYQNVAYYREIFESRGIRPEDIHDLSDLHKVPFLTKEIIRDNLEKLAAEDHKKSRMIYATTGGSTGIPMGFFYEKGKTRPKEKAFMNILWSRAGFKPGARVAVLRGSVIPVIRKDRWWCYEPINNRLIMSSYHMTDDNLPHYIEKIRSFKPSFLHVYPSSLTILARFMKSRNIKSFSGVSGILAGSENIYDWQIELFEEVFKCRVLSWYGQAEAIALAGTCECSNSYHIFPEYGYFELVDQNGKVIKENGQVGEIVGTSFDNFAMPLIRYKTQDLASYKPGRCKCGRNYPLLTRIEGRLQELIVTRTGRLISMTAINMHGDVFDNVKQFQFYQEDPKAVVLNIVKKQTFSDADTAKIKKELMAKLGYDIDLILRFVETIPLTVSGKHRFLIQKLPVSYAGLNNEMEPDHETDNTRP